MNVSSVFHCLGNNAMKLSTETGLNERSTPLHLLIKTTRQRMERQCLLPHDDANYSKHRQLYTVTMHAIRS